MTYASGITGSVYIDDHGDRDADFALQFFQDNIFTDFAEYHFADNSFLIRENVEVIFSGGVREPPSDHPKCGWDEELCQSNSSKCTWRKLQPMACFLTELYKRVYAIVVKQVLWSKQIAIYTDNIKCYIAVLTSHRKKKKLCYSAPCI